MQALKEYFKLINEYVTLIAKVEFDLRAIAKKEMYQPEPKTVTMDITEGTSDI